MSKRVLRLIPSIILYICAILLAIYAIWSYTYCADVISEARAAGQLATSGNEYDIANFYMSYCGQYAAFALLVAAAGLLLQRKQQAQIVPGVVGIDPSPEDGSDEDGDEGDEPDEWYDEEEASDIAETKWV